MPASLSMGAPFQQKGTWNQEGGGPHVPGTSMKEGSRYGASLCEGFHKGGPKGGLLYWGPWKICQVRLGNGHLFPQRPLFWGTWRSASILGPSYLEEFLWLFREICKMSCKLVCLSTGALLDKLEGVRLPGFLREKKSMSGFLSWTQRTLRF